MEPELMITEDAPDEMVGLPRAVAEERRARVLVVEDDPEMRMLVALVLRREGYEVVEADDGIGLLECLQSAIWNERREPIDVIVSDIQMPDLTALEVLQALPGRSVGVPIVLMTAYGADRARGEARQLGAVAVLDKPLDWQKLRLAVQNAAALRRVTAEVPAAPRAARKRRLS